MELNPKLNCFTSVAETVTNGQRNTRYLTNTPSVFSEAKVEVDTTRLDTFTLLISMLFSDLQPKVYLKVITG